MNTAVSLPANNLDDPEGGGPGAEGPCGCPPRITFAVVGDNRGDSCGLQSAVFGEIVRAIQASPAELVLNVGDMIDGYPEVDEAQLRRLWAGYRDAIAGLGAPVYHAPGNHDLFDECSARLWSELWGPTYYALDRGGVRFIALDTETQPNRLGGTQFNWLAQQLAEAADRPIFLFLHRPLFPVNGHRGLSLDVYPAERDQLHRLLVRYRDSIKGVFQGHEHLYHFERRDGVPYYILGGGGEELYTPPELGGFFHFLLVRVEGERATPELHRVGVVPTPARPAVPIAPASLLEEWSSSLFWYTWDQSVRKELIGELAGDGRQGLKVWFDLARYEWPILMAPLTPARDWSAVGALCLDVCVPEGAAGLSLHLVLRAGQEHEAPLVPLGPGWNRVRFEFNDAWFPRPARAEARELRLVLTAPGKRIAGWVVFDNLRTDAEGTDPHALKERWEGRMLWGAWGGSVTQEAAPGALPGGGNGLKVRFDLLKHDRPVLFASVHPPWDLGGVRWLTLNVYQPPTLPGRLELALALTDRDVRYLAPATVLEAGWNQVAVDLHGGWLPREAAATVTQFEWAWSATDQPFVGWLILGPFRAEA